MGFSLGFAYEMPIDFAIPEPTRVWGLGFTDLCRGFKV